MTLKWAVPLCHKQNVEKESMICMQLSKNHEIFLTKTIRMHEEKIERIDKFLKLMEQNFTCKKSPFQAQFRKEVEN